jgi:hypothetical protein
MPDRVEFRGTVADWLHDLVLRHTVQSRCFDEVCDLYMREFLADPPDCTARLVRFLMTG